MKLNAATRARRAPKRLVVSVWLPLVPTSACQRPLQNQLPGGSKDKKREDERTALLQDPRRLTLRHAPKGATWRRLFCRVCSVAVLGAGKKQNQ
jgi:hypothetical protein